MSDEKLPKEALLLKFLNMTTSPADGEALTAMRKANELLRSAGWTWEMLLAQKIKIIENPFTNLRMPERADRRKPPPPPPQQTYATPPVNSSRRNSYSGVCWCCGTHVDDNQGYIFTPNLYNGAAPSSYKVICALCNRSTSRIADTPAPYAGPPQPTCRTPVSSNNPAYHEGDCYCCGAFLPLGSAFLFSPKSFNSYATTNAALICDLCNQNAYLAIPSTPHAPRSRPQPQYSTQPRKKRTQTRRYMPGIDEL